MIPTHTLSALDVALADCLTRRVHFPSTLMREGALGCRICGVIWETREAWAADSNVCPGVPS